MSNEECKKRIIEMVNQVHDNPKLRRIYLILVVIIGGGWIFIFPYSIPSHFFINSSKIFNLSGSVSARRFTPRFTNSFSVILSFPRLRESLSSSGNFLYMFSSPPSPVRSQISFTANTLQTSFMILSVMFRLPFSSAEICPRDSNPIFFANSSCDKSLSNLIFFNLFFNSFTSCRNYNIKKLSLQTFSAWQCNQWNV